MKYILYLCWNIPNATFTSTSRVSNGIFYKLKKEHLLWKNVGSLLLAHTQQVCYPNLHHSRRLQWLQEPLSADQTDHVFIFACPLAACHHGMRTPGLINFPWPTISESKKCNFTGLSQRLIHVPQLSVSKSQNGLPVYHSLKCMAKL